MPHAEASLWELAAAAGLSPQRFVADRELRVSLGELLAKGDSAFNVETCRDRCVFLMMMRQLSAVLAALALDGVARRIVVCPTGLAPSHTAALLAEAEADVLLLDTSSAVPDGVPDDIEVARLSLELRPPACNPVRNVRSEWLLFTSGTTGRPKMVVHTLGSLAGKPANYAAPAAHLVWSTFYDVRRYGGMQILLRALLGGGSLVLSDPDEAVGDFLRRAGRAGVTHISGTPSHWRRALMSPEIGRISPSYIRLSGEVADQAVLNQLKQVFPKARIVHAFASTEAGVAFDVDDGLAGFPVSLLERPPNGVEMRVRDGSLLVRSPRIAARYAHSPATIADAEGFVDTNDMVERRGDRYFLTGRREGIINVGGQKVHPEEVEAVVNLHPAVRISRVRGRSSGITGALVIADIVVGPNGQGEVPPFALLRDEVLDTCRRMLPAYKVPAMLYQVEALGISAAGKLQRALA